MKCEDELCGIDTETELIQNSYEIPHGVIAGFCSGSKCELVHWKDWKEYLPEFLRINPDTKLVFFNLPFDVDVLGSGYFLTELDRDGRMMELGANYRIHRIGTDGWFPGRITLYDIVLNTLHVKLNKEDGTRTSFTRDMELTEQHLDYLVEDCASTYLCGLIYNGKPTESEQARGCYVLSQITRNGMLIDVPYVEKKRSEYTAQLLKLGEELRSFGFRPKQDIDDMSAVDCIKSVAEMFGVDTKELEGVNKIPAGHLWFLAALLYTKISSEVILPSDIAEIIKTTISLIADNSIDWLHKEGKELIQRSRNYLAEQLDAVDASTCIRGVGGKPGKSFKPALYIISLLAKHFKACTIVPGNMEAFNREFYAEHEYFLGWLNADQKPLSPDKFVQQHLRKLMAEHPGLEFPLTDGARKLVEKYENACVKKNILPDPQVISDMAKYAFSKADMWLLEDAGVTDPFLEKYADYKHAQKMLSTYFTLKYLEADGRNHSKYDFFKVTGRTGSSKPNASLQFFFSMLFYIKSA